MRAGHIIFGVDNLHRAVKEWQEKGFNVEYGKKSKKHHALIYFSEGAFIELMDITVITKPVQLLIKLMGWGAMLSRMRDTSIVNTNQGVFCIEQDEDLSDKVEFLEKNNYSGYFLKNVKRNDTHGRKLKWKLFFPNDLHLPFLMTYYNIDPKPKNFVHPNGVKAIKKIKLTTSENSVKILEQLLTDDTIVLEVGDKNALAEILDYEYA